MRAIVVAVLAIAAQAQQQPAARAEFDVVSVKPGDPKKPGAGMTGSPGRLAMRNFTLKVLVMNAYGLNEYQIEGGPKWLGSAKFDIDVKFPAGAPRDQTQLMMQAMLADRFRLTVHRESKTRSEYALVVGKGGPKLQMASDDQGSASGARMIRGTATASQLADMLGRVVGAPVIDQTGLTAKYKIDLKFAPLLETSVQDETLPDIFAAVQEGLGLKLEAIKGPVEVLVIDHAEMPSAN